MIGLFPDPYPDELLYSVCARFTANMCYPSNIQTSMDIFGRRVTAITDLPSCLSALVDRLPPDHSYTVDRWIDEHTLLPFYAAFLPLDRLNQVRDLMKGVGGMRINMYIGTMGSSISKPAELRFCPSCVLDDRQKHGETYWHRVHQVPGVQICPIHRQFLHKSCIKTMARSNTHE